MIIRVVYIEIYKIHRVEIKIRSKTEVGDYGKNGKANKGCPYNLALSIFYLLLCVFCFFFFFFEISTLKSFSFIKPVPH